MREQKFKKLSEKWKHLYDVASEYDSTHNDPQNNPYWKKWSKYGKILFDEENRRWRKIFNKKILKNPLPYSAGAWILEGLFLLVERTYTYWTHGYNVWAADPYRTTQVESVSQAMFLVEALRESYDESLNDNFPSETDKELLEQLIKILTNESFNWYD